MPHFLYGGILLISAILLLACTSNVTQTRDSDNFKNGLTLGYNLEKANKEVKLSNELREISGLTYVPKKGLVAVQDEKGALYWLDKKGNIDRVVDFSADGDYEGIAFEGNRLFVLRSDGVLFKIDHWKKDKKKTKTQVINTNLGEINDTEGLAYHSEKKQLWIACKGSATIGTKHDRKRAVYVYDLTLDSFFVEPLFTISHSQLKSFINKNMRQHSSYSYYKKLLRKEKPTMPLRPSAIAIHPITQDIYLLCAVGSSLLVLDKNFVIKALCHLSDKTFEQPEGLAFNEKGDLFLSSEGRKRKARLYKFDYNP